MPPLEAYKSEIGSRSSMCQAHTGAYVSLLAPGKPTKPLATQERLPRIYYTLYLSLLRIRTTDASQLEKRNEEKIRREKRI